MKIQKQRTLFEVINLLLALLLIIPLGVFIEQICGYQLYRCCFVPCLAVLGYLAGRWSMTRPLPVAIASLAVSFVIAVVLSVVLTPAAVLITILMALYSAFFTVFFYFSARKAGYTVFSPMSISGILLHILVLICCTGFHIADTATSFISVIAIIFFLLTLYSFSAKGLRKSLHKNNAEKHVVYPAGMQMGNFLLVTGFILIAAFISNIHPIFKVFSGLFVYVLKGIAAIFGFISGLFSRRSVSTDVDEGVSESAAENSIFNNEPKGESSIVTAGVEVFAFILVIILFAYLAFLVIQRLRKAGLKMPAFLKNLRDKFNPIEEEDFVDETENLFDSKKLLKETGRKVRDLFKKVRERPQKISDFEDNRTKVRFAFQQMLKKIVIRDPHAYSKTPNELYKQEYSGEEDFREFMDYYNKARYSNEEVSDDAAESAECILKQRL